VASNQSAIEASDVTWADEFRWQAEVAEASAARAKDVHVKRLFLDIAARWRELARKADRLDAGARARALAEA
jgi:hypothetical protein